MRPCVALLHSFDEKTGASADPEISLIPKLDAREVAAVFTAPFANFLRLRDDQGTDQGGDPGQWYRGSWSLWHHSHWRSKFSNFSFSRYFQFPVCLFSCSFSPQIAKFRRPGDVIIPVLDSATILYPLPQPPFLCNYLYSLSALLTGNGQL